ncbi:MAG: hypothetical protein AYK22_00905 [Thermoplasmatales archaeon SG8-52-3]|nr:MAG: hypothetical protein AYK22_00905 [Thermoplasmatales archaeon SG8-52-3]
MSKKWFSLTITLIFILTSFSVLSLGKLNQINNYLEIQTSSQVIIKVDNAPKVAKYLISEGFDVFYNTITENSFELIVTPDELDILKSKGYNFTIISYGRPFIEIQSERNQYIIGEVPPGYLDHTQIIEEMYGYESLFPSICKVYDLTDTYGLSATYDDNHIYAIKISDNVEEDEDEPNFLMVSCHHAREIVTPVIALYSIDQFTANYGSDPDITALVDEYEIWISPVWNPDGYDYVYYFDNMWRKNRQPYSPGIGVDLNRNYPFGWDSECSGSTDPTSETYKGPSSASEVETQTMIEFSNDRHFTKVLDYHSHGQEVLYGYCCHSHPFSSFIQSEATDLSNIVGYGGYIRVPSAEGENYEWQIASNGSYANLIETHITFQPEYNSAVAEAEQLWPGTIWMLERPISVSGHVIDSITGEPLVAKINLQGITFPNDEEFFSEPRYGRYHLFLPPGTYDIEFSLDNYHSQIKQVTVSETSSEILEISLDRYNEAPDKPSIDGPTKGVPGINYEYIFSATDPDNDNLEFYIKWGDDNCEEWIGPYSSGVEFILNHSWEEEGTYSVSVKVRDPYQEESSWVTIQVKIPRYRVNNFLIVNLLERFYNHFKELISIIKT